MNSNRKYSIAVSTKDKHPIQIYTYTVEQLLNQDNNIEIEYSCQEYTDDILDLSIGKCIYIPMRDNLGDILIKRLK